MANKVEYGLENVYIAFLTESTVTYGTPVSIPGAVTLSLDPEGGQTTFYADNIAYHVVTTNNGYSGELTMALVPDSVLADMLDWHLDDHGMLVEVADGVPAPFALLFEVAGDAAKRRNVYYKCTASRPKVEHTTKTESTEPATTALSVTITPIEIANVLVVKGSMERGVSNVAEFDAFFDAVLKPSSLIS